jgi:hypothetical protein
MGRLPVKDGHRSVENRVDLGDETAPSNSKFRAIDSGVRVRSPRVATPLFWRRTIRSAAQ